METNVIFSEDRGEFLEHYGVPGMKWGKWNAETQRKYTKSPYSPRRDSKIDKASERLLNNYVKTYTRFRATGKGPSFIQRRKNDMAAQKYARVTKDPTRKAYLKALVSPSITGGEAAVFNYMRRLEDIKQRALFDAEHVANGEEKVSDILRNHAKRPDVY